MNRPSGRHRFCVAATTALLLAAGIAWPKLAQAQSTASPPVAPVRPVVDTPYGITVTDPYRYMENLQDTAVQRWFREENTYTRTLLDRIPGRAALLAEIRRYDRSEPAVVSDVRRLPGDLYFYEKTLPDQQMARLYLRRGLRGPERVVFDPTTYERKSGRPWAINYYSPSLDAHYVAVGISPGGSEHADLHVVDTRTGRETGVAIERAWFGQVYWRRDDHSFFYNRVRKLPAGAPPAAVNEDSHVYLHVVGTDPDQDRMVFGQGASPDVEVKPRDIPWVITTPDSPWALGLLQHGAANDVSLYVAPVDSVDGPAVRWRKVAGLGDAVGGFLDVDNQATGVTVHGDQLYVVSHKDAPRCQVLRTSLGQPDIAHAQAVVPQGSAIIKGVAAAGDALYVKELDGVVGRILRVPYGRAPEGPLHRAPEPLPLPFEGTVTFESVDPATDGALFDLQSWIRAPRVYTYDPGRQKVTDTGLQPAGLYDTDQALVSEEIELPSYDGAMVPLSITHPRRMKLDGSHPALLMAYGAYGATIYPAEGPGGLRVGPVWSGRGGVFAVCHVRGGGVYGESWHEAGRKLTKPNTWRDLIACAQYLTGHGYTASSRLTLLGGSAGGIAVGRALTERPDLFASAIDEVGMSDPLRFEVTANGPVNVQEFGSVETQEGFEDLFAMDAYQHVRDGVRYPAVLLTTGWNDPRVAPWQAGKMAARLQAATASDRPVLLRVDYQGGHGIGSSRADREAELADGMTFALWQSGLPGFQPTN